MKRFHQLLMTATCLLLVMISNSSCGLNPPEDPDHPLYVTYTISGEVISFEGPDQLLLDVRAWLKANSIANDVKVSYSTGDLSEFAATDADAVKKYENEFLPKVKEYLKELNTKLSAGTYGKVEQVKMILCTYASRKQGEQGTLKYEQHEYSYPTAAEQ